MRISTKKDMFDEIRSKLISQGFKIARMDDQPIWGGSIFIDESSAEAFAKTYFPDYVGEQAQQALPLQPKILVVAPGQQISWQYHTRRTELWQVIVGEVGVITNVSNEETAVVEKSSRELILLAPQTRHRLVGLKNWGIIAQIWQHTDVKNPSDEKDVVRLN